MRIKFNGAECETSCVSSAEFFAQQERGGVLGGGECAGSGEAAGRGGEAAGGRGGGLCGGGETGLWIINGFATREDLPLAEGDELFIIPKNSLPPEAALDAMMRARHTPRLHDLFKRSTVAICGLGGLGSHIAINLARSGLGRLILIDFDSVDASNLNRQAYRVCDLGRAKTKALAEQIAQINPFVKLELKNEKLERENLPQLLAGADLVCEAFDSAAYKALLAQHFHAHFPHTPLICASGLAGYGQSNQIKTRKIAKHFYLCGDLLSAAAPGRGLMAPRVNICAAHQANLVLELLADGDFLDEEGPGAAQGKIVIIK